MKIHKIFDIGRICPNCEDSDLTVHDVFICWTAYNLGQLLLRKGSFRMVYRCRQCMNTWEPTKFIAFTNEELRQLIESQEQKEWDLKLQHIGHN